MHVSIHRRATAGGDHDLLWKTAQRLQAGGQAKKQAETVSRCLQVHPCRLLLPWQQQDIGLPLELWSFKLSTVSIACAIADLRRDAEARPKQNFGGTELDNDTV